MTDQQFFQLCQNNRDLQLEKTAEGKLIIMPPTGWKSGNRNSKLTARLELWADRDGTGITFDSSTGFKLPNGATRSPDAAWIKKTKLAAINPNSDQFLSLAPDFIVELCSASDSLERLQQKMQEYRDCGVDLGWLIDTQTHRVEIYRPQQKVEIIESPSSLSGENILKGFQLDLTGILD